MVLTENDYRMSSDSEGELVASRYSAPPDDNNECKYVSRMNEFDAGNRLGFSPFRQLRQDPGAHAVPRDELEAEDFSGVAGDCQRVTHTFIEHPLTHHLSFSFLPLRLLAVS